MTTFRELREKKNLIVLDGPMGTELERRGYDVNDLLWSARFLEKNPDAILQIHRDYFRAGADIGTCASYQAAVHPAGRSPWLPAISVLTVHTWQTAVSIPAGII